MSPLSAVQASGRHLPASAQQPCMWSQACLIGEVAAERGGGAHEIGPRPEAEPPAWGHGHTSPPLPLQESVSRWC